MVSARLGTGSRWHPSIEATASDLVRARDEGGLVVAALANGFDCGFATCWPTGSRLLLDLFDQHWAQTAGTPAARLEEAFRRARQEFCSDAPSLIPGDADFPDATPAAVLLTVAVEGHTVHVRWLGGDLALLVRGSKVVTQTRPHTLREKHKEEFPDASADLERLPNVLSRTIGLGAPDDGPSEATRFIAQTGDTVVLVSKSNFRGPCVEPTEIARLVGMGGSPENVADQLADLGYTDEDTPFATAAVIRID